VFNRIQWRIATTYVVLIGLAMLALGTYLSQALRTQPLQTVEDHLALVFGLATATTIAVAIGLAILLARAIVQPIGRLTRMAHHLAAGDLEERITLDRRGEVGELAAAFNDMADALRRTIRAVEEQSAEVSAILAGMADGVMIVDDQDRVITLNRAAERFLETTEVSAQGKTVAEVTRRHELVRRLAENGLAETPLVVEVGHEQRQVQVAVTSVRLGGSTRRIFLFQDVTALRRAEAVRRDFVANVSHELRTPLAALRAVVETLEAGALDDPPAAREFLSRMHVEVDELSQMVEELLALARIESGRVQLRFNRTDLGTVVGQAAQRLEPQAGRQGVALLILLPEEPILAVVDAERLQQVVINLVHNAIKFTPPAGKVEVSVERRGDFAAIVVADTGVGLAPSELPRLFERFYKADRSRGTSGTGLGLAIVKHLVQAHRGRIAAESPGVGRGATFTVLLPLDFRQA
jgi:two-component system phosphate regulon sensor histidine kinase PhoR